MSNDDRVMKLMEPHKTTFPLAEGIGIFVGVASWYLLTEGKLEIAWSLAVAVPGSLLWFGVRCWKNRSQNK